MPIQLRGSGPEADVIFTMLPPTTKKLSTDPGAPKPLVNEFLTCLNGLGIQDES